MSEPPDPLAWLQAQALPAGPRLAALQGLARRAAALPPGALRSRLLRRLQALCALLPGPAAARAVPAPGLWAQLPRPATGGLRAARGLQRALLRHRVQRRLQTTAAAPEGLGPLHAQALLPAALALLQQRSPEYLARLFTQLDALAALDPAAAEPKAAPASRSSRRR